MISKQTILGLALTLTACGGEPSKEAAGSAPASAARAPKASSSAAPDLAAPSPSPPPTYSSSHGSNHGASNEADYAFAKDVPRLVAAKAGAIPRYLRVELTRGRASVLAVTDKEPTRIRSYTIEGGAVTNVEEPSAIQTRVFVDADVDWERLPGRAAEAGMHAGIDVENSVFSMVLLPNSKGAGAMIHFVVAHSGPRRQDEYDAPAK